MVQARPDGLLPYRRHDNPPGAETIRRNKELYGIRHPEDVAAGHALGRRSGPAWAHGRCEGNAVVDRGSFKASERSGQSFLVARLRLPGACTRRVLVDHAVSVGRPDACLAKCREEYESPVTGFALPIVRKNVERDDGVSDR